MSGYMNEIALLKRLEGNSRIIGLIDSELKAGPGGSKGHLLLVMECGEIDFAGLLSERQSQGLDMVWVAYYWQQVCRLLFTLRAYADTIRPRCSKLSMSSTKRKLCILI